MTQFTDKIILVTGGGSGIGRAAAVAFAQQAGTVVVNDINAESAAETVRLIKEEHNGHAIAHPADVADADQVKAMIAAVVEQFGRLDVAFNNAGIEGAPVRTADVTEDDFDRIMGINVKGVWLCMKHEIVQMVAQGGGAIVNTASVAGLQGAHSLPIYSASKHAVVGLTKTAALEYVRKGVRVNAVCPAVIRTPMVERTFEAAPQIAAATVKNNPSRRLGTVEEVASAVLWLADSKNNGFVNGVALPIDGGLTAT